MVLSLLIGGEEREAGAVPAASGTATSVGGTVLTRGLAAAAVAVKVGNLTDDAGTGADSSVPGRFLLTAAMLLGVAARAVVLAASAVVPGEVVGIPVTVPVTGGTSATVDLAGGRVAVTAEVTLDVATGVGVVGTDEADGMVLAGGTDVGCVGPADDTTPVVDGGTDDVTVVEGWSAAAVTAAMAAVLLAATLTALVFATLRALSAAARRCSEI